MLCLNGLKGFSGLVMPNKDSIHEAKFRHFCTLLIYICMYIDAPVGNSRLKITTQEFLNLNMHRLNHKVLNWNRDPISSLDPKAGIYWVSFNLSQTQSGAIEHLHKRFCILLPPKWVE